MGQVLEVARGETKAQKLWPDCSSLKTDCGHRRRIQGTARLRATSQPGEQGRAAAPARPGAGLRGRTPGHVAGRQAAPAKQQHGRSVRSVRELRVRPVLRPRGCSSEREVLARIAGSGGEAKNGRGGNVSRQALCPSATMAAGSAAVRGPRATADSTAAQDLGGSQGHGACVAPGACASQVCTARLQDAPPPPANPVHRRQEREDSRVTFYKGRLVSARGP